MSDERTQRTDEPQPDPAADPFAEFRRQFAEAVARASQARRAAIQAVEQSIREQIDHAQLSHLAPGLVPDAASASSLARIEGVDRSFAEAQEILSGAQRTVEQAVPELEGGAAAEPAAVPQAPITAEVLQDPMAASDALMARATESLNQALQQLLQVTEHSGESDG